MNITILGCGASAGVPIIGTGVKGGFWGSCDPSNPKNRRSRASLLLEDQGQKILIDTSPDLRQQLLPLGIDDLDAILYTHEHADHTHGIDELKVLYNVAQRKTPYPIYGDELTLEDLQKRFFYLFESPAQAHPPILTPLSLSYGEAFTAAGLQFIPFEQDHIRSSTVGYRYKNMAYSTDVKILDDTAFSFLTGLDLWIVDCLSDQEVATHSHLSQTLEWIERVKPKRAILTHMSSHLDYEVLRSQLPKGVEPAYDGMVITG